MFICARNTNTHTQFQLYTETFPLRNTNFWVARTNGDWLKVYNQGKNVVSLRHISVSSLSLSTFTSQASDVVFFSVQVRIFFFFFFFSFQCASCESEVLICLLNCSTRTKSTSEWICTSLPKHSPSFPSLSWSFHNLRTRRASSQAPHRNSIIQPLRQSSRLLLLIRPPNSFHNEKLLLLKTDRL